MNLRIDEGEGQRWLIRHFWTLIVDVFCDFYQVRVENIFVIHAVSVALYSLQDILHFGLKTAHTSIDTG